MIKNSKISDGYVLVDNHLYRIILNANQIIAIAKYKGKYVRAVAKCHPNDTFNEEYGKNLAIARLNLKIKEMRVRNAADRFDSAINFCKKATEIRDKSAEIYNKACYEADYAYLNLRKVEMEGRNYDA